VVVSSLLVEEIKRIIKSSEIMKYAPQTTCVQAGRLTAFTGKMTPNGLPRIRMDDRS
jgi:hypothetical protein